MDKAWERLCGFIVGVIIMAFVTIIFLGLNRCPECEKDLPISRLEEKIDSIKAGMIYHDKWEKVWIDSPAVRHMFEKYYNNLRREK